MTSADRIINDPLTGQRLTFLETAADTNGRSLRAEVELAADGYVPRHLHIRQDEQLKVLVGSVRYRSRGEDRELGPGETMLVPRRRFHRVSNAGNGTARFVLEVQPARHIEQTMRLMFAMGRTLSLCAPRRPDAPGGTNS